MTTPSALPGLELRPPWPDEFPRLKALFKTSAPAGAFRPRVLVAPDPERIVGALLVSEPEAGREIAVCRFVLRPAFRTEATLEAFLGQAGDLARELGAHTLAFSSAGDTPDLSWLKARRATVFKETVFYEGDGFVFRERLAPLLRRAESQPGRFQMRPPRPEDYAELASILAAHGLMDEARALDRLARAYDPALCLVSTDGDRIAGALLTFPAANGRLHFESRVVAPAFMASSARINLGLLDALSARAYAAGFTAFLFSCQPHKERETVNFARRCGCRELRRQIVLHLPLELRGPPAAHP